MRKDELKVPGLYRANPALESQKGPLVLSCPHASDMSLGEGSRAAQVGKVLMESQPHREDVEMGPDVHHTSSVGRNVVVAVTIMMRIINISKARL